MKYCICLEDINYFGINFTKNSKYKYEYRQSNIFSDEADERYLTPFIYIVQNDDILPEMNYPLNIDVFKTYFLDIDENRRSNLEKLIPNG
jgi:hypothetical protein